MNVLMLSLMYPEDTKNQVARDVKDKLQNQINSYQRAFVEGIRANLEEDERWISSIRCRWASFPCNTGGRKSPPAGMTGIRSTSSAA